jgi:hypothetical protein
MLILVDELWHHIKLSQKSDTLDLKWINESFLFTFPQCCK